LQHFKTFTFHAVVQQGFFKKMRNITHFIDNLLLFKTVKEFPKSVNSWRQCSCRLCSGPC